VAGGGGDEVEWLRAEVSRLRCEAEAAAEAAVLADKAAEEARGELRALREQQLEEAAAMSRERRDTAEELRLCTQGRDEAERAVAEGRAAAEAARSESTALREALQREQATGGALFSQLEDLDGEARSALQEALRSVGARDILKRLGEVGDEAVYLTLNFTTLIEADLRQRLFHSGVLLCFS
jgi:chromosome segregation ATPase